MFSSGDLFEIRLSKSIAGPITDLSWVQTENKNINRIMSTCICLETFKIRKGTDLESIFKLTFDEPFGCIGSSRNYNLVYVSSFDNYLYKIDLNNGGKPEQIIRCSQECLGLIINDDCGVAYSLEGRTISIIKLDEKRVIHSYKLPDEVSSYAIDKNYLAIQCGSSSLTIINTSTFHVEFGTASPVEIGLNKINANNSPGEPIPSKSMALDVANQRLAIGFQDGSLIEVQLKNKNEKKKSVGIEASMVNSSFDWGLDPKTEPSLLASLDRVNIHVSLNKRNSYIASIAYLPKRIGVMVCGDSQGVISLVNVEKEVIKTYNYFQNEPLYSRCISFLKPSPFENEVAVILQEEGQEIRKKDDKTFLAILKYDISI